MAIARHRYAGSAVISGPKSRQKLTASDLVFADPMATVYKSPTSAVTRKYDKGMEFNLFGNVPMQDWDFPDGLHPEVAVTINDLGDVLPRLEEHANRHKDKWRLYTTPGGVRAFNLSKQVKPTDIIQDTPAAEFYRQSLNSDPYYAKYTSENPHGWASRISGKPKRLNDFVAYHLADVGPGVIHPENLDIVTRYHDIPILENKYVSDMDPHLISRASAHDLVNRHLSKVPRSFAAPIEQRLERQGLLR